ncbi:MAG TPA: hypothetical protein PLQ80_10790 [Candidatus Syntrophosphaera sp.]|nr:hypothetical protein [Candidatus Syntrophosphaera sp.]HPH61765.1 hypothetical protein [Candidatus Syntrophosphaera sp.]
MKIKFSLVLAVLLLLALALSAQDFLSKTAVGIHAGTQSGVGYSMRFMGEKHGLQATFGAGTWGSDNVYFPTRFYYWYDDGNYDDYWYGDLEPGEEDEPQDTLVTLTENGRYNVANLGLNYIYTLDKFDVFKQKDHGRLYVMAGGSYQYYRQNIYTKDYHWVTVDDTLDYDHYAPVDDSDPLRESRLEHRWTAGAGLGVELAFGKNFRVALELPITYNWEQRIVMYIPQIGLYYYFK